MKIINYSLENVMKKKKEIKRNHLYFYFVFAIVAGMVYMSQYLYLYIVSVEAYIPLLYIYFFHYFIINPAYIHNILIFNIKISLYMANPLIYS